MKAILEYTHDIRGGTLLVCSKQPFICGDAGAHELRFIAKDNGAAANLTSASIQAYCVLSNRSTATANATKTGNIISVTFPAAFYALAGDTYVLLRAIEGSAKYDLLCLKFNVTAGTTSTVYDPSGELPDLSDFQTAIDAANAAAASANTAASAANTKANAANTAAGNANTKANAANTAAGAANDAASNANIAADDASDAADAANDAAAAANTAASAASAAATAADEAASDAGYAADAANAAALNAADKADAANTAAGNANTKANAANTAAGNAQAVANKFATVDVEMEMLAPSADPTGSMEQTANKTTFSFGIPASNLAYATFYIDENNHLIMTSPDGFSGINYIINRENGHLEVQINA